MNTQNAPLVFHPIPHRVLQGVWLSGVDEFGRPAHVRQAEGGEPLRCCLTLAQPAIAIALISHRPSAHSGPYAEVGPVFVHQAPCAGLADDHTFPPAFRGRRMVLRSYAASGEIVGGVVAEPGSAPDALDQLMRDKAVAWVHSRNVVHGCWNFTAARRNL